MHSFITGPSNPSLRLDIRAGVRSASETAFAIDSVRAAVDVYTIEGYGINPEDSDCGVTVWTCW